MRNDLMKALETGHEVNIIYLAKNGEVSQRRIKVLQINEDLFKAYCYLRKSNRTFKIDNVLALVPTIKRERIVV